MVLSLGSVWTLKAIFHWCPPEPADVRRIGSHRKASPHGSDVKLIPRFPLVVLQLRRSRRPPADSPQGPGTYEAPPNNSHGLLHRATYGRRAPNPKHKSFEHPLKNGRSKLGFGTPDTNPNVDGGAVLCSGKV